MKVIINDPQTPTGTTSELVIELKADFIYDKETYGNGHHVTIQGKKEEFLKQVIDLRYDRSFDRNNKEKWLDEWARNYWNGKNGAWSVKTLEITKAV